MTMPNQSRAIALMSAILLAGSVGCDQAGGGYGDEISVGVRGLNYTDIPVGIFYVEDKWASNVGSYNAATSSATSYSVPKKWRPGLKVRIDWRNDLLYREDKEALTTTIVEIPPYELPISDLFVAFLPCNRIQVFVSFGEPGHESFPDKRFINPRDYCAADARCRDKFIDNPKIIYDEELEEHYRELEKYHEAACKAVEEGTSPL